MKCIMCFKKAEYTADGNSYCEEHFLESPYYAEIQAKRILKNEKAKRKEK